MKNILASQLERLLAGVSDHGVRHLAEVEADLAQTAALLGEAIEKLGASFTAIHVAACAQQEMMDRLAVEKMLSAETIARLKSMSGALEGHATTAVVNLQFHDLTSQLLERVLQRVAGLQQVLAAVGSTSLAVPPESGNEQVIALLNGIGKKMAAQSNRLDSSLWKTVRQDHMESGEIELF